MVKINQKNLNIQISFAEKVLKKEAEKFAKNELFLPAAEKMREEFEEHPVTEELRGGIDAENISQTLSDVSSEEGKNLYSFIGFYEGTDPIEPLEKYFDPNSPEGPKLKYVKKDSKNLKFTFVVKSPDLDEIYRESPMPWANGRSWAKKIESGISGLGRFLNKFGAKNSRSGGGIQVKNEIRSGRFRPKVYLSGIIKNFIARVSGKKE